MSDPSKGEAAQRSAGLGRAWGGLFVGTLRARRRYRGSMLLMASAVGQSRWAEREGSVPLPCQSRYC